MRGYYSFKGGVHPPYNKNATSVLPIEVLPPPPIVIIPMAQHLGAPAIATVKKGDKVKVGQTIGEAAGFVSAPVHASVSGTVLSVGLFPTMSGKNCVAVEIQNDGLDEKIDMTPLEKTWKEMASAELVTKISLAGIVGMGGASFPTHVKLSPPSGKSIDTLIINGAECEPYLTADHRLMLEKNSQIIQGALIVKRILSARNVFIAVEDNKPDVISLFQSNLNSNGVKEIVLAKMKTKYPQGGEKQLISAITGRHVPSGGLPMDVGCVVHNVGTVYAIWNAIYNGIPLYERVVTVTGPAVREPKNLLIRTGTPIEYVLQYCKADFEKIKKIILGGPMMGIAQSGTDITVTKSTSGILALDFTVSGLKKYECINCGSCHTVCPIRLVPALIVKYVEKNKIDKAYEYGVSDCIECGCCSYECPAKINLVHFMKLGKYFVSQQKAAIQKK